MAEMFVSNTQIPFLSTEQMREVDRAMVEDYHIELLQMMENAGRNLADPGPGTVPRRRPKWAGGGRPRRQWRKRGRCAGLRAQAGQLGSAGSGLHDTLSRLDEPCAGAPT